MARIKIHENQGTGDRLVEVDFPTPPQSPTPRLTDAERRAEQDRVRAEAPNADEFWIFGFGSLMWRPGLKVAHREPATLQGYKRRFEIWSTVGRGTLVQPGLGCCLVPAAGSCRGIAYGLCMTTLDADLEYLWKREMGSGVYRPTWVELTLDTGEQKAALTFVIRKGHEQHTGPMPATRMAEIMGRAAGENGRCRDYLANTLTEMAKLGDRDPLLEEVMTLIDAAQDAGA